MIAADVASALSPLITKHSRSSSDRSHLFVTCSSTRTAKFSRRYLASSKPSAPLGPFPSALTSGGTYLAMVSATPASPRIPAKGMATAASPSPDIAFSSASHSSTASSPANRRMASRYVSRLATHSNSPSGKYILRELYIATPSGKISPTASSTCRTPLMLSPGGEESPRKYDGPASKWKSSRTNPCAAPPAT